MKNSANLVFPIPNRLRNLPKTLSDLPFPILNRSHADGSLIRSLNNALDQIVYGIESFYIEEGDNKTEVKLLNCKKLYWFLMNKVEIHLPWKNKWEQKFPNIHINWNLVWKNIHNNMLKCEVQSKLWEVTNLNFISSLRLSRMYEINNFCLQCKMPEQDIFHIFFSCEVSKMVYTRFLPILNAVHNLPLTEMEIAFGLEINDTSKQKCEQLRNYIFSIVKFILFKDRATIYEANVQKINAVFNKVRNFIISDLKNNFILAKQKNCIPKFIKKYLVNGIIAEYNEHNRDLQFNI